MFSLGSFRGRGCRVAAGPTLGSFSGRLGERWATWAVGGVAATLLSCAGSATLDLQIAQVARGLSDVEARGALRCAPRELAVARSHLEFARLERTQGFPERARHHVNIADENVRAANVLSPPGRCGGAAGPAGTPRTEVRGDAG